MKKLTALLFTVACATTAFAGNDGPQADSKPPVRVLAQALFSGGLFTPPNAPVSRILNVSTDGAVTVTYQYRNAPAKTLALATLANKVTAKLVDDVAAAVPGKVVDSDPSGGCEDAPFGSFTVFKENGTKIVLGENSRCKELQKENLNSQESEVLQTLRGLTALDSLVSP